MNVHKFLYPAFFSFVYIYLLQGAVYAAGSILSKTSLLCLVLVSVYYFFKTLVLRNSSFYYLWTLFLLTNIISYLVVADVNREVYFGQFKMVLFVMMPFYPILYFSNKGLVSKWHFVLFFFLLLPVLILNYKYFQNQSILKGLKDFTNNNGYDFTTLLPLMLFPKINKIIKIILFCIIIFFIVQSNKRGAIISVLLSFLIYMYINYSTIRKNFIISISSISITAGVIACIFYYYYFNNEYAIIRMSKIFSGGGSGRTEIYSAIINKWYNSTELYQYFIGFGFAGTIRNIGHWAHNDWLQVLMDYGIFGVILYLSIYISALKILTQKRVLKENKYIIIIILVNWLLLSFYSMWYANPLSCTQVMLLAFLGHENVKNKCTENTASCSDSAMN